MSFTDIYKPFLNNLYIPYSECYYNLYIIHLKTKESLVQFIQAIKSKFANYLISIPNELLELLSVNSDLTDQQYMKYSMHHHEESKKTKEHKDELHHYPTRNRQDGSISSDSMHRNSIHFPSSLNEHDLHQRKNSTKDSMDSLSHSSLSSNEMSNKESDLKSMHSEMNDSMNNTEFIKKHNFILFFAPMSNQRYIITLYIHYDINIKKITLRISFWSNESISKEDIQQISKEFYSVLSAHEFIRLYNENKAAKESISLTKEDVDYFYNQTPTINHTSLYTICDPLVYMCIFNQNMRRYAKEAFMPTCVYFIDS